MSLSMSQASQGKWEYVPSKKDKEQGRKTKKAEMKVVDAQPAALSSDQTMSAFAALDKWQRQPDPADRQDPGMAPPTVRSSGGYFTAEEERNLAIKGSSKPKKAAPPQQKKPKVKKVKVTAREVGEQMKASEIASKLSVLEKTYTESHVSQCEMLADYLWKTFQDADLAFNKLLSEQHPAKVVDMPLQFVSSEVAEKLKAWVASREFEALKHLVLNLITAVFEGLPDFNRSSKQAPVQPPKAKVGLLLLLSVVLRARPEVLVPLCPALLAKGSELTAPLRLPQTHWMLSQLATCGHKGTAIHVWCAVVLPQILGTSLAAFREEPKKIAMMQKEAAISSITWLGKISSVGPAKLPEVAKSSTTVAIDGKSVPILPSGAVEALIRSLFGGNFEDGEPSTAVKDAAPKPVRVMLEIVLGEFKMFSISEPEAAESLSLALETAEMSSGSIEGVGSRLVSAAALRALAVLADSDTAFKVWEEKHKKMIKGSARILQHIMVERPQALRDLLARPGKAQLFAKLLSGIRGRHRSLLESGKGWQRTCAAASDQAAVALSSSASQAVRRQASGSSASTLLFTAFAAATSVTVIGLGICCIAEPDLTKLYATRIGLPEEAVDQVLGMVPPEYTAQLRTGLATVSAAVPAEVMEKISQLQESANQTLVAVAGQASEVWRELIKQYSH